MEDLIEPLLVFQGILFIFHFALQIKGTGNSTTQINYQFLDDDPDWGLNYYRLKQVDYNGVFSYSKIIAIKFKQSNDCEFVQLYHDGYYLNYSIIFNESTTARIEIINTSGNKIFNLDLIPNKELNMRSINIGKLAEGIYLMMITLGKGEIHTRKFVMSN